MDKNTQIGLAYAIAASCLNGLLGTDIIQEACKREGYTEEEAMAVEKIIENEICASLFALSKGYKRKAGLAQISQETGMYD